MCYMQHIQSAVLPESILCATPGCSSTHEGAAQQSTHGMRPPATLNIWLYMTWHRPVIPGLDTPVLRLQLVHPRCKSRRVCPEAMAHPLDCVANSSLIGQVLACTHPWHACISRLDPVSLSCVVHRQVQRGQRSEFQAATKSLLHLCESTALNALSCHNCVFFRHNLHNLFGSNKWIGPAPTG